MLERNNPKTLHQQLKDILMESIESGQWGPDERIPSENQLSETYGLSRMTVRAALTDLVREGLLYRVQGKGTFVSGKISTYSPSYIGIRQQLEEQGFQVETRLTESGEVASTEAVAKALGIPVGSPVFRIQRVRYVKGEPIGIHTTYLETRYSGRLTPELLEKEQLCVLLSDFYGLDKKRADETLEAVRATGREAQLLHVEPGHPLLLLKDTLYAAEAARPYECTKVVFRGDKIKLHLHYEG